MKCSAEIRWFFDENCFHALEAAFLSTQLALGSENCKSLIKREPLIVDQYLILENSPYLGMKYRKGKFQIKLLSSPPSRINYNASVIGRADEWVKVSKKNELFSFLHMSDEIKSRIIPVNKHRILRKYTVHNGHIMPLSFEKSLSLKSECTIELVKLSVDNKHQGSAKMDNFVSLAFSTYADKQDAYTIRDQVAEYFFNQFRSSCVFSEDNSHSYPEWLIKRLS